MRDFEIHVPHLILLGQFKERRMDRHVSQVGSMDKHTYLQC